MSTNRQIVSLQDGDSILLQFDDTLYDFEVMSKISKVLEEKVNIPVALVPSSVDITIFQRQSIIKYDENIGVSQPKCDHQWEPTDRGHGLLSENGLRTYTIWKCKLCGAEKEVED